MTKKETIKKHREKWDMIYKICLKKGDDVCNYRDLQYIENEVTNGELLNNCFLCEYVHNQIIDCKDCPLAWSGSGGFCQGDGEYSLFYNSTNYKEAAEWARRIRDLPEKGW